LAVFFCFSPHLAAGEDFSLLRDAEIEEILTDIVKPIFKIAGLRPSSAKVYVVNSDSINAFTFGNGYVFINSGLLLSYENPLHVIAVLCHETGHIAAGHINTLINKLQKSSTNMGLAAIAGAIGTAVTGSDAALIALLGYSMTEHRLLLRFSREQEFAADALAASYLTKLGYDSNALIDVFHSFERMEILGGSANVPVYIRSHPKSRDRISAISRWAGNKKIAPDEELQNKYNRVVVKLRSYLKSHNWLSTIPSDPYAQAIYYHKSGMSKKAVEVIEKLINEHPNDIYYKDTLAQILCESGNTKKAVQVYRSICNDNSHILLKIDTAKAMIEANQYIDEAIVLLESSKYIDNIDGEIFRLLAKAYGKKNREGLSFLFLAEEQMIMKNYSTAYNLIKRSIAMMDRKTELSKIKKAKYMKSVLERDYADFIGVSSSR
jgi:predicted Zn-dependent protease